MEAFNFIELKSYLRDEYKVGAEVLINVSLDETRIARLENGQLVEIHIERSRERSIVGNIYRGRVTRVLPGMQAAFVEMGLQRTAFLYVTNILDPRQKTKDSAVENNLVEDDENLIDGIEDGVNAVGVEEKSNDISAQEVPDISKLVTEGQHLLVQVIKAPMGTKGARLTAYISIPGRFLVYLPESRQIGVSRRIESPEERERLKDIIAKHRPELGGFIIRTVAEGASEKHLRDDMDYLVKLWGSIKKSAGKQNKVGLLYSDLDLAARIVRDRVSEDVERIVVDNSNTHKQLSKFVQSFLPRFKKRIEFYRQKTPLFEHHGLETEISRAISRKVWLKSGGYIVIDETEALTSIDVNTGRFVGRRNLEDTILQTNLEAVKEIAYQIRLRNLGGIIVLDFIDMTKSANRDRVFQAVSEELQKDPVRTNVLPVSALGLIEMTRKRTQESLRQKLTSSCGYCDGKGFLKSRDTIAYEILREAEKEAGADRGGETLVIYCHPRIAEFFADEAQKSVEEFEQDLQRRLLVKVDPNLHQEEYEIFTREK